MSKYKPIHFFRLLYYSTLNSLLFIMYTISFFLTNITVNTKHTSKSEPSNWIYNENDVQYVKYLLTNDFRPEFLL